MNKLSHFPGIYTLKSIILVIFSRHVRRRVVGQTEIRGPRPPNTHPFLDTAAQIGTMSERSYANTKRPGWRMEKGLSVVLLSNTFHRSKLYILWTNTCIYSSLQNNFGMRDWSNKLKEGFPPVLPCLWALQLLAATTVYL